MVKKDVNSGPVESNNHLAVANNATKSETVLANLANSVKAGGFVFTAVDGDWTAMTPSYDHLGLALVFKAIVDFKTVLLFRKVRIECPLRLGGKGTIKNGVLFQVPETTAPIVISVSTESYKWVEDVKAALVKSESEGSKVLLVSEEDTNGIVGMVNCLTKEPGGVNLRYLVASPLVY